MAVFFGKASAVELRNVSTTDLTSFSDRFSVFAVEMMRSFLHIYLASFLLIRDN